MICNFVRIENATSLHTSTQMGKNGSSACKLLILTLSVVLQGICAPPTQCNSSNVTDRNQCANMQLRLAISLHMSALIVKNVHPQCHVTCLMSQTGHNVRTCNLAPIGDATSLHTTAQIVHKSAQGPPKLRRFHGFLPHFGFGTQPMCILNAIQLFHCYKKDPM